MNIVRRFIATVTPKRYASGKRYHFDRNRRGGWKFSIQFGPGAGYAKWNDDRTKMLVVGRTLYLAHNSGSNLWAHRFRNAPLRKWEFGLTTNANLVPYAGE